MLATIRNNKSTVVGMIVTGLCAFLMLGFGIDTFMGPGNQTVAIKVDSTDISFVKLRRQEQLFQNMYRQQFGENYDKIAAFLNIEQRAMDSLITETLLLEYFRDQNLSASPEQIRNELIKHPFFSNGFNKATYENYLRRMGLTGPAAEQAIAGEIVRAQLQGTFARVSAPTPLELKGLQIEANRNYEFSYVRFIADEYTASVDTSNEEAIAEFFAEHQEQYRSPVKYGYSYVVFSPGEYRDDVEVTEADLKHLYERQREKFVVPEQIRLREIIFYKHGTKNKSALQEAMQIETESSPEEIAASNKAAKERAEVALAELIEGTPFADVANAQTDNEKLKGFGGDLGWMTYESLHPKVAEAARQLDIGERTEVIDTDKGYVIVELVALREESLRPFEEVKAELTAELKTQDAPMYAYASAEEFEQQFAVSNSTSLAEFAESKDQTVVSTDAPLPASQDPAGAPPGLTKKIAELAEREVSLVQIGSVTYLVQLDKLIESTIPELAAVKPQVVADYVKQSAEELAGEAATAFHARLTELASTDGVAANDALQQVATELKRSVEHTPAGTRQSLQHPIVMAPGAADELFTLHEGNPVASTVFRSGKERFVVVLKKRAVVEPDDSDDTLLIKNTTDQGAERLMQALVEAVRAQSEIWINPSLKEANA